MVTTNLERFFKSSRTKKAKLLESKLRFFLKIWELLTGEYLCGMCSRSTFLRELPGEFRDFDADDERGGSGVPLCTQCLGTNKFKKTLEFQKLQEEARKIRSDSFTLQIKASEERKWNEASKAQLRKYNARLSEIAKEALGQIKYPTRGCLAKILQKD